MFVCTEMKCENCGSGKRKLKYDFKEYKIYECADCGLRFLDPNFVQKTDQKEMYSKKYFEDVHANFFANQEEHAKKFLSGLRLIKKHKNNGKLLDVGCATGFFLSLAKRDFYVYGLDISEYAVEVAKKNGLNAKVGELKKGIFQENSFDIITMWDFIEHVPNPNEVLNVANGLLKKEGILYLLTTNENSLMVWLGDILYKTGFRFFSKLSHPVHHAFHFSDKILFEMLRKNGFRILETRKSEMPVSDIEQGFFVKLMASILYVFSGLFNWQHEIRIIAVKK